MSELFVRSLEDAVIRLCTAPQRPQRVVVDTSPGTFLAFNQEQGYAQLDFRRPAHGKIRELCAVLEQYCDLDGSDRYYAGLYRQMIRLIDPEVELVFTRDAADWREQPSFRESPRGGTAELAGVRRPSLLRRALTGGRRRSDDVPDATASDSSQRPAAPRGRAASLDDRDDAGESVPASGRHGIQVEPPPPGEVALVAFGDSYTYGTEIDEFELGRVDDAYRIERAFPRLLAQELGIRYGSNLAEPGRSNRKIMHRLCEFVARHRGQLDRYLIVVGLTHPARKVFTLKDGREYLFINRHAGMDPWIIKSVCVEVFYPEQRDRRLNEEVEHKYWVLSCFLRKLGCRFAIFPAWNFAHTDEHFRGKDLGREGIFYFGERQQFGFDALAAHLPRGSDHHPLSEGHALFARELAREIRQRSLV
jgi:hypothetical protein